MPLSRLPRRDPRTVARDIPGVLDILFPRLTGGLVGSLNKKIFSFPGLSAIPNELVQKSDLQKSMLFEIAVVRAEALLRSDESLNWNNLLHIASDRQRQHYDARIPDSLSESDIQVADHAAHNLEAMLTSMQEQNLDALLEHGPLIPGLGWVASGSGDFALGNMLIEVKHTDQNFRAGDFRQVLMYWLLKYASSIEINDKIWSKVLFLNPRKNIALQIDYDYLLRSASSRLSRIELVELLRSIVGQEINRR